MSATRISIILHAIYHGYASPYMPFIVCGNLPRAKYGYKYSLVFLFCDVCRDRGNVSYQGLGHFLPFSYFASFLIWTNQWLSIEYPVHISQVSA